MTAERGQRGLHAGATIKAARMRRGWTQEQLAAAAGVSPTTVRAIEKDRFARPSRLVEVADALGLDPRQFGEEVTVDEIRARMPADVRAVVDVLGGWLSALPEQRRSVEIHRLTNHIFGTSVDTDEPGG